jgi:hypothetical protein
VSLPEGEGKRVSVGDGEGATAAATTCSDGEFVIGAPRADPRPNRGGSVAITTNTSRARPAFGAAGQRRRRLPDASQRRTGTRVRGLASFRAGRLIRLGFTWRVETRSGPSRLNKAWAHSPKRRTLMRMSPA